MYIFGFSVYVYKADAKAMVKIPKPRDVCVFEHTSPHTHTHIEPFNPDNIQFSVERISILYIALRFIHFH